MIVPPETVESNRAKRLGSADIAALLRLDGAFGSPYSVWLEKTRGAKKEETEAMRFGKHVEPYILSEYQRFEGSAILVSTQEHYQLRTWPVASATLDAVGSLNGTPIVVEAKSTRDFKWSEVPAAYQAQVQWQMGIAGIRLAHVAVFFKPTSRVEVFPVLYEHRVFEGMLKTAQAFWNDHVLTGVPPETDGHDATTEALGYWDATDAEVAIDHLAALLRERGQVAEGLKAMETRKAEIDNAIKGALGEASTGTIGGRPAVKWSKRTVSRFDQKLFKSRHPRVAARYVISSEYRALTVKKEFSGVQGGEE